MTHQSGTTYNTSQMQGEIPATATFNFVAPPVCLRERTPYIALSIEPDMLKDLRKRIRPVYTENKSPMIATCAYGASLEPPRYQPVVRAIAAINDYQGLQIILCTVNGENLRKDGIPYHMILSHDAGFGDHNILDSDYRWPVTELGDPYIDVSTTASPYVVFNRVTTTMTPYERVISASEKRAEDLAIRVYQQEYLNSFSAQTQIYDIVPIDIELALQCPRRIPPVVRVDYHEGRRAATSIVW